MNVIPCVLALAVAGAPSAPAACSRTDHRCKARDYERKAARADAAHDRAVYLLGAHRSYWFLYQETEAAADLCAARSALAASVAVEGQPDRQRADSRAELTKLASIAKDRGIRCSDRKRPPKAAQPLVAATTPAGDAAATSSIVRATTPAGEPATIMAAEDSEVAGSSIVTSTAAQAEPNPAGPSSPKLMPPAAGPRHPFVAVAAPSPAGEDQSPEAARPGRPLVIVGSAALGVGLTLGGVAAFAGSRAVALKHQGERLIESTMDPDEALRAQRNQLDKDYRGQQELTRAAAIAGGAAVLVGSALIAVGVAKRPRATSRTAFAPVPGGLVFRARF